MDYGRIDKPLGGGFSPRKLRSMLMGVEKKRKEEEEMESRSYLRSDHFSETDVQGYHSSSEPCKDVDVVSELPECSSLATIELDLDRNGRSKDNPTVNSKMRSHDECGIDYNVLYENTNVASSLAFEFQKAERASQRVPVAPFSKPTPSKWDDAQKWIASSNINQPKPMGQAQGGQGAKRAGAFGYGSRQSSLKNVDILDPRFVAEEPDTKRMDPNQAKKEDRSHTCDGLDYSSYPVGDLYGRSVGMIEKTVGEPPISLSHYDSDKTATTSMPPPSTAKSVSMRDMGTEMTPVASQEPSRTGTPVKVTSPSYSPCTSQPPSPGARWSPSGGPARGTEYDVVNLNKGEVSDKEMQMRTRREIMVLGTKLGKMNIAAWASKENADKAAASSSLRNIGVEQQVPKSVVETRAEAWEEAEKTKYMARYEREELKIQAWENHQKAKTEAEMRKLEVEVERMRARAQDKLMKKLASARHKAEAKRAAAEDRRDSQAAQTEEQAEYIRKTGRIPSKSLCCCVLWWRF